MPQLRSALLAEYARVQDGLMHVIGAGIDSIEVGQLPVSVNFSAALVITFTRSECGRPHRLDLILQSEDGERLSEVNATTTPQWNEQWPPNWMKQSMMALNFGVRFPIAGVYTLEVLVNDSQAETLQILVRSRDRDA